MVDDIKTRSVKREIFQYIMMDIFEQTNSLDMIWQSLSSYESLHPIKLIDIPASKIDTATYDVTTTTADGTATTATKDLPPYA